MAQQAPEAVAYFRVNGAFYLAPRSAYVVHGAVEEGEVRAGNFLAVPYSSARLPEVYTGASIRAVESVRLAGGHEDVALLLASDGASLRMWDELIAPGERLEVWEHDPTA